MALRLLTAGESHGPALTVILDGLPAGLEIHSELINHELARRQRGMGAGPRMKLERDAVNITGGVMGGATTGAPVAMLIENLDHSKWKGKAIAPFTIPRPGHADLTGALKYAYRDLRPSLERASARETAARVAGGAVCKHLLAQFDITINGYVVSIGEIEANLENIPLDERSRKAEGNEVRCPEPVAANLMQKRIQQVIREGETLGGVVEIVALGLPPGLGSFVQWDRRLEARLGAALLSVQAIKGVEFGPAFANSRLTGSLTQDAIHLNGERLTRLSMHSGGIEGGITTGQPLIVRAAMKPIATTLKPQSSVDLATGEEVQTQYERSDFCPVPRAVLILEAMTAFVLADALIEKLGGDSLAEMLPRYTALRQARLTDLKMDDQAHTFWFDDAEEEVP